jgi:hypothetical protein
MILCMILTHREEPPDPVAAPTCEIILVVPTMSKRTKLGCPICKKPVASTDPDFPFCSERCRTIDLGKWASGQYVISSPVKDTSDDFEQDANPGDDD